MANVINKINIDTTAYNIATTAYAVCHTDGGTSAKVAYIQDEISSAGFTLIEGVTVHVKFTFENAASNPTLDINGTGAKVINCLWNQAVSGFAYKYWESGEVVTLTYDGTCWQVNKSMLDINSLALRLNAIEASLNNLPIPSTTNSVLVYLSGNGDADDHTPSDALGLYPVCMDCGCRKQSDDSIEAARSATGYASLHNGGPNSTNSISIFLYNYTSLAMYFSTENLEDSDLPNSCIIQGIDLFFNTDPGTYGTNVHAYAVEGDTIPTPEQELHVGEGATYIGDGALHIDFATPFVYSGQGNLGLLFEWHTGSWASGYSIYPKVRFYFKAYP